MELKTTLLPAFGGISSSHKILDDVAHIYQPLQGNVEITIIDRIITTIL